MNCLTNNTPFGPWLDRIIRNTMRTFYDIKIKTDLCMGKKEDYYPLAMKLILELLLTRNL